MGAGKSAGARENSGETCLCGRSGSPVEVPGTGRGEHVPGRGKGFSEGLQIGKSLIFWRKQRVFGCSDHVSGVS